MCIALLHASYKRECDAEAAIVVDELSLRGQEPAAVHLVIEVAAERSGGVTQEPKRETQALHRCLMSKRGAEVIVNWAGLLVRLGLS
jgi:hypothetical protein